MIKAVIVTDAKLSTGHKESRILKCYLKKVRYHQLIVRLAKTSILKEILKITQHRKSCLIWVIIVSHFQFHVFIDCASILILGNYIEIDQGIIISI